jgi:hypothetical protein
MIRRPGDPFGSGLTSLPAMTVPDWLLDSDSDPATRWQVLQDPADDVLRALDQFRVAGGSPDRRVAEAVAVVRDRHQPDGTWLLENTHPAVHFALEDGDGRPSRWNALRALRVLEWHERSST